MYLRKIITAILILLININAHAKETLIFAVDLVRHGDRTPQLMIPKAAHQWAEGNGELTAQGMKRAFQLGVSFRKKYIHEYHLLPKHYQNGTMLVFSTAHNRALMSAQSILLGLYPLGTGPIIPGLNKPALPGAYQPIPIHTRIHITDDDRKKYQKLLTKYVTSQLEWKKKSIQLKNKLQKWSLATGLTITTIDQLKSLASTLHYYQLHHIPTPAGLTQKDIDEIIAVGKWVCITKHQTKETANFFGQPMLANIADRLQQASLHTTPLKYILFSDHETMIMSIMTVLQNPLHELPPYTADLNFALFKTESGSYLVKVSYNGKPVVIPGCGAGFCSLKYFMEFAHRFPWEK